MIRPLAALAIALTATSALAAHRHHHHGSTSKAEPATTAKATPSLADILAKSPAGDWRPIDNDNLLYMELPKGRVVIELAPEFAPNHVANIKALVRSGYFDASAVVREQDNYVAQWAAPDGRPVSGGAKDALKAEFDKPIGKESFVALPDPDTYAPKVGFSGGFPAARDPKAGKTWLVHCYGMVGAGRDEGADTGGGKELYAVIGEAPRNLDRNVTLVGRVVQGIDLLSSLPRGTGDLGFYKTADEKTAIRRVRVASDLAVGERTPLETLRTDSDTFKTVVQSRRFRHDSWYKYAAGKLGVCNVAVPVRVVAKP